MSSNSFGEGAEVAVTLEETIAEATKNNRICPIPGKWQELYKKLPGKNQGANGRNPPLPLILAAWHDTPALMKQLRLQEHIEWAAEHGALDRIYTFLISLSEEEWHHFGE